MTTSIVHFMVRWLLATWLVLVGIVYGIAALGFTSPPSRQWGYMASALICFKIGQLIAAEKRLPF